MKKYKCVVSCNMDVGCFGDNPEQARLDCIDGLKFLEIDEIDWYVSDAKECIKEKEGKKE